LRLMLYTNYAWRLTTGTQPPRRVEDSDQFMTYVRAMDGVGNYADWYDRDRIVNRFGEWFTLENYEYLTENKMYAGVILKKL